VIRASLLALTLALVGCGEDTPTITTESPAIPPTESSTPAVSESEDINITATEYAFEGVPDAVSAGLHRFILENAGEEQHELYLFYITGDQTLEELLELPEKQVNKFTQAVDRVEAGPGASDQFNADLVPGRFGYVCFVESADGTPHAFLGMVGEFTVV
jgi:uncharacterized cupredoxin-like copper-binding protein